MHRLIGSSKAGLRRYSWFIWCGLLVVLLSLFASVFSHAGLSVHAATRSSLKNIHSPGSHHPNSYHLHMPNFSHISLLQSKSPTLTLTRTMSQGVISHGKQTVNYMLSVSNGRSSGPVEAGNTIIINDIIPVGMTDVTIHASYSDWRVKLTAKAGISTLTGTYVGAYPVLAGASLSPLLIHGVLKHSNTHPLFQPAIVRLLHADNAKESGTTLLQQQSAHDFTVQNIAPRIIKPLVNPTYQVGQTVEYTLAITNSGTAGSLLTGDSVTVTDAIPAGLTGLTASASSSDWTISLGATTSPTTLTATYIGTYPVLPGATFSPIIVVGTLTMAALPQVANTAVVVTPNDSNSANNSSTSTITVLSPDLTITDPVPPGTTFEVGKPVTYTITGSSLSGAGSVLTGNAITITDTIPAGLTGITATDSSGNWSLSLSSTSGPSTLTATYIGAYPVAAGTTLPSITITGTLTSAAVPNLANNAAISTPNESNTTNNTASNTIPVVVQPDLTLTKTVPTGTTFEVGKPVTYTFTAKNASSVGPILTGDSIIITDPIPAGLTGLTASANSDWTLSLGATTSPTTLTATYTGTYPVASGATLSPITLTGTPTTPAVDVSSTRVGYWPFDENSGTIAYDSTSNHDNGTITGTSWIPGKFNSALSFNGTSDYVSMGSPAALQFGTGSFTIMAWFKTTSTAFQRMVDMGMYNWSHGFELSLDESLSCPSTPCVTAAMGGGSQATSFSFGTTAHAFADGNWHQAALVVNQTTKIAQLYVDGVVQSVTERAGTCTTGTAVTSIDISGCSGATATNGSDPFVIGAYQGSGGFNNGWNGSLDEVRAYNSALSSTQIQNQYPNPQLINTATVATPNDGNNANNSATAAITIQPQPDLTLTKTVPPGTTFQVGKTVTYTLTPGNSSSAGPILASDPITITDTIPAGLTGLTTSANSDWSVSLSTTTSPATLTATYTGTYPVASGATLSPITLTGTLTTAALSTNPIPTGYWSLDENSGTTAYDSSPNHNNGAITGTSWTTGKINSGLSFNGSSDYVNMGNSTNLQLGANSSFTVMAWFKTSASPTFKRIVSEGVGNWNGGFTLGMSGTCTGCITGEIGDTNSFSGNAMNFDETTPFNDGAWHQAALVVDRTAQTAQIYIDGVARPVAVRSGYCGTASGTTVSIASCNLLTTATTDPFIVGAYKGASGSFQYFNGSIDEVRFYNNALTSAQIQKQYIIDTPPTPTGYWPFDANTGTTAYDLSSNHNNGTLTGGPTWVVGAINSGLSFNGTSNYVTMGNLPALQFGTGSFTALAWFKTTTGSGMMRILNQGAGNWNGGFNISMNAYCSGCLTMEIGGSGTGASSMVAGGSTAFNDGKWHQVAMVVDGTAKTAQLYVDGVAQTISVKGSTCGITSGTVDTITSCSSLTANTTDPFVVGAYTGASGTFQYFNGSIDEVRVYSSALSSAQIQNLYAIPFTNTAAVTTPNDGNFTNNGAINTIMVLPQPDLSLSKTSTLAPSSSVSKQAQEQRRRSLLKMRPS